MLSSLIAGFTASAFSLPFDLLKSRLRKFDYFIFDFGVLYFILSVEDGAKYSGVVDAVGKVLKNVSLFLLVPAIKLYVLLQLR